MMNNEKIKTNKKIMMIAMVFIAVFAVGTIIFTKGNVSKLFADITSLKMKNNIIILNKNNTLVSVIYKTGELNITITSDGQAISDTDIIKTSDVLKYNNVDYPIAVLADPNKDGYVDGADISRTYKIYKGIVSSPETVERLAADANEDDSIDGADISRIYKIYRGLYNPDDDINPDVNFTVTFNSNGGSEVDSITKHQNETLGELPEPTKEGCVFEGWYTNEDYQLRVTSDTKVTGNVTYYAKWSVNNYIVTYDSNGGTSVEPVVKHQGETLGTLPEPTKEGFNLEGWYTEATGGTKVTSETVVTESVIYYAHWGTDAYTISFNSMGGTSVASITKQYNEEIGELPEPTKEGYTFQGWYTSDQYDTQVTSETLVTKSTTYYARWQANSLTITFDTQVDDNVFLVSKEAGETLGELPVAEREGYSLEGWFTDTTYTTEVTSETVVVRDTTFYAKWGAEKFTVTFDANGGTGGQTDSVQVSYNSPMPAISTTAPTRENYYFIGWYDENNEKYYNADGSSAKDYDKNENTTLYAHWTGNDCTVTFDTQVDGNSETITVSYNEPIGDLPEPTRTGYEFEGWFTDTEYTEEVTSETIITENVTYYAKWNINNYVITLNTLTPDEEDPDEYKIIEVERQYNEMVGELPEPTKAGYSFVGWYEDEEYETEVSTSTYVTGNVTYYAKWETRTYLISFDSKGGSDVSSITRTYHQEVGELPTPTKEGYTLLGWYTNSSYTTQVTSETLVEDDAIYCAKWLAKSYTITFDTNGGTGGPTEAITVSYKNGLPNLSDSIPTKTGNTFEGWFDSNNTQYYSSDGTALVNYDKTENTTLYAHWTVTQLTVTFDANGGTISTAPTGYTLSSDSKTASKVVSLNENVGSSLPTATKENYTLDGWYTEASGGTKITSTTTVDSSWSGNKTYYAHWTPATYTITFNANYGDSTTVPASVSYQYSETGTITLPTKEPEYLGYTFLGWSTTRQSLDPELPVPTPDYYPGQTYSKSNKSKTLYAVWDNISVLFIGDDATIYNHMPVMFQSLGKHYSGVDPDIFMVSQPGVADISQVISTSQLKTLVQNNRYDYVVLENMNDGSFSYTNLSNVKSTIRNTSGSKSAGAIMIDSIIVGYPSSTVSCNKSSDGVYTHINTTQRNMDSTLISQKASSSDIVALSGTLLYDYICTNYHTNYDREPTTSGNFNSDSDHLMFSSSGATSPATSYLYAELLASAIYGYNSQSFSYISTTDCKTNHYNSSTMTNDFDSGSHTSNTGLRSAELETQRTIWNYITTNKKCIK
ncbi:MAG: InlB B-repeat-containing protein [Bacilli bacterium]|nr:InlB B-repeat-containing protein [Bacilli bacterium]